MKTIILSAALLALAVFAVDVSADDPGTERGKKRGDAAQGERGGPRGAASQRDPAAMVTRLIEQFDKDGDQKLDVTELTAMLKSMRDRRGSQGRPGDRPGARPGQRPDASARGRRGGNADEQDATGGAKPKRPE